MYIYKTSTAIANHKFDQQIHGTKFDQLALVVKSGRQNDGARDAVA